MSDQEYLKCNCTYCGGHIEFPADGVGATIACPHCGFKTVLQIPPSPSDAAPEEKKSGARTLIIVGVVVLIAAIPLGAKFLKSKGKADSAKQSSTATATNTPVEPPAPVEKVLPPKLRFQTNGLEVYTYKIQTVKEGKLTFVIGSMTNHTDNKFFNVKVEFALLAKDNSTAGKATDLVNTLLPHRTWDFKALIVPKGVTSVRPVGISAEEE